MLQNLTISRKLQLGFGVLVALLATTLWGAFAFFMLLLGQNYDRSYQVVIESFLALPFIVARTDRIAFVQGALVPRLTVAGDVRALPCPFDVVPLVEAMWWHPAYTRDPEHAWLRTIFAEAGKTIEGRPSDAVAERQPRSPASA